MDDGFKIDAGEDVGIDRPMGRGIGEIIEARLSRRDALLGTAAVGALATVGIAAPLADAQEFGPSSLRFREVPKTYDQRDHVAEGYDVQALVRWGDPVTADAPAFVPGRADPAAAAQQFGYNNDFLAYMPIPWGSNNSEHGLLVANHEYTNSNLSFRAWVRAATPPCRPTRNRPRPSCRRTACRCSRSARPVAAGKSCAAAATRGA